MTKPTMTRVFSSFDQDIQGFKASGMIRGKLLTVLLALLLTLFGAALGWQGAALLQDEEVSNELQISAGRVLNRLEEIIHETNEIFDHLDALALPHCSDAQLLHMRTQLFEARFLKDIGGIENLALRCSTALGRLETPLQSGPPDLRLDGGVGLRTDRSVLASARFRTMVLEDGHFNALVDPRLVTDLTASTDTDEIFLRPQDSANPGDWHPFQISGQNRLEIISAGRSNGLQGRACGDGIGLCILVHRLPSAHVAGQKQTQAVISSLGGTLGLAVFFAGLSVVRQRQTPEFALGQAIRNGHLHAVYQPILSLPDQKLYAFEALARWTDPHGNSVPPEAFIELAERSGQISQISALMIRHIGEELGDWLSASGERRIALNIAPAELADDKLIDHLESQLLARGVQPDQILLEITERTMLESDSASRQIEALTSRGFRVFADDFGVGYCGLAYLNELAMDGIKISQSFTAAVGTDSPKASLVPRIIQMAREMGLEVIVEGVENERQCKALNELGPLMAQGWYFSRELPIKSILKQFS